MIVNEGERDQDHIQMKNGTNLQGMTGAIETAEVILDNEKENKVTLSHTLKGKLNNYNKD